MTTKKINAHAKVWLPKPEPSAVSDVVKQAAIKSPAGTKLASAEAPIVAAQSSLAKENGDKSTVTVPSAVAKAPSPSVWGSKPLDAVKKAAPIMPQPQKQQPQQKQEQQRAPSGSKLNQKREVAQSQQGHGGRDGGRGNGRQNSDRSVKTNEQGSEVKRQQQPHKGRGGRDVGDRSNGGGGGGGSDVPPANTWAALAASKGGVKADERGQTNIVKEKGNEMNNNPPVTVSSWARAAASKPRTDAVAAKPGTAGITAKCGTKDNSSNRRKPQSATKVDGGHRKQPQQPRGGNNVGGDENNTDRSRAKAVPLDLLTLGEGKSDTEKLVIRIDVEDLLVLRMNYLAPPSSWESEDATKPPTACLWDSPTRISDIEEAYNAPRIGGDVSQREMAKQGGGRSQSTHNDTAPALEDCKPLEVNDETRWKAKVMEGDKEVLSEEADSNDEILRKAMLILNKLSLTKFDKLSDEFINTGIGRDIACLTGAVDLIVNYAQQQQHFSEMYARLCLKLAYTPMEGIDDGSKKGKTFKNILLQRCQTEFETDISTKIKEATEGMTDKEQIEYTSNLIKTHYLGHVRFIGELYKGELISIKIMLFCLLALLLGDSEESSADDIDEEKIACFTKLMTLIGSSLEQQSEYMKTNGKAEAATSLADCWRSVEKMAREKNTDGPKVSNRIKFMLQDLLEMKGNGWVTRRKEETAKTLDQIHEEVAKEERAALVRRASSSGRSVGLRRGVSTGDVRVRAVDKQVDEDGFVSVAISKGRSVSYTLPRSQSDGFQKYATHGSIVKSTTASTTLAGISEEVKPRISYPSPDECGDKAKTILKEFFVNGETLDAVVSIQEIVGAGSAGSLARGAAVIKNAVLLVLEMRQEDVDKFLEVCLQCVQAKTIESESIILGLNDPLEFLSDIAIDAPLAIQHLVTIVAKLVKTDIIPFDFLLNSPDYFRTDGDAANFAVQVIKTIGNEATSSEVYTGVIEKLMTDGDREKHSSAINLIAGA